MKDKINYDPTDADTIDASDKIGSFTLDGAGTPITSTLNDGKQSLDVNITSEIAVSLDGVYDGVTNTNPDNVGAIVHVRAAAPADADQTKRTTGAAASSDAVVAANAHGADVIGFSMGYNGTTWDRLRSDATNVGWQIVQPFGNVADDAADAGNPVKVGQRAVSGALTAVSASNDRADQISDLYRRQWVNTTPNIAGANASVSVDDTVGGVALLAAHPGRRKVRFSNNSNKEFYWGFGTVTTANGERVSPGSVVVEEIGPDLVPKGIASTGFTVDVRVVQVA